MKRLAILGSTGSIGRSTLSVVDAHPDKLEVTALAAGDNAELLGEQVARYRPNAVAMATSDGLDRLRATGAPLPRTVASAMDGLIAVATHPDVDIVICASAGTAGLEAVLAAIEAGKDDRHRQQGSARDGRSARHRGRSSAQRCHLPVDSEHNAIHQCLHGRARGEIRRLILTASVGRFEASRQTRSSASRRRLPFVIRRGGWDARSRSTQPR